MALTRIPRSLMAQSAPIRWVGSESDRLALTATDLVSVDVNYFFFQNDGKLFRLSSKDPVTWVAVKGEGVAEAVANKLEKTDIGVTADTGLSITRGTDDNTVTIAGVDATASNKGVVQFANADDITTGTSTTKAVNVAQLQAVKDGALVRGDITSDASINLDKTGTGNSIAISLNAATDAQLGGVELATDAEVTTGTSTNTVMTTKQVVDAVNVKLDKDFSSFTAAAALSDSDVLAIQSGTANQKITASALKTYVTSEIDQAKLFKGYYATDTALNTAWDASDASKTPEAGSFAIVESTDSIWVWNSDSTPAAWEDTRVKGTVDASTQIIAGTGLTGGGTLADDVTLAVSYGNTAGTACEGNDERLSRTPIVWVGDSTAFSSVACQDWHVNYLFVVKGIASDDYTVKIERCISVANNVGTFETVAIAPKVQAFYKKEGVLTAGTTDITYTNSYGMAFDLYLSGIRQNASSYTIDATNSKIVLSESIEVDVDYALISYPFNYQSA